MSSTTAVSTPAPLIRTVLGDVAVGALGPTDYHEHLFQRSPLLPGEDLDDEERSRHEAGMLRASGAAAMVEATPFGVGRRPSAVARISARTGLTVVHVTGAHREAHYPDAPGLTALAVERLHELFLDELTTGMTDPDGAPSLAPDGHLVCAGVLKIGVGYWAFSAFERRVAEAAARCSAETGAPVMVHLEHGSAAHETLDLLAGHECPPERVVLAHIDRNPDPGLLGELASRGAYLGFDGAARHQNWPDSMLIECIRALVEAGWEERILLGGDVARASRYVAYGGMPGLQYLFDRFIPRVRAAIGSVATDRILVENARRWLAWAPETEPHHVHSPGVTP